MNFKRLYFLLLATPILFLATLAHAQTGGSVSGKLVDGANGQPLEFATVSLINKADNKPFRSTQTALGGGFNITGVPNGTYIFRASFVGYISFSNDNVLISGAAINLGAVKLTTAKGVLKEVQVTAQRSQIQLSTDKKVFSVDQSLVSQGGSATDLLSNVPSVQVDVDGNINLRGSSDVRILINGKPSALTGANLADILQSIPASSIENIEVITNPSSKYDAEGQSGIINIVLKRNAQVGFNGSASVTAGTQHTYNTSLNLAYQTKAVNLYTNYSFRKGTRIGNGTSHTITNGSTGTITQDQVADQSFNINSNNIRSGVDFYLDKKTTLSLTNNINIRTNDRLQNGFTNLAGPTILETITRNNTSNGSGHNLDFNLDFSHKYKKPQQELTANIGYSTSKNDNTDYLNTLYNYQFSGQLPTGYNSLQNNFNLGNQHNLNLQADYVLPLKNSRLEMGYRSTFNKTDNNYTVDTLNQVAGRFVRADTLGNLFTYNEQVHALYTNYQHSFGNFSLQAGLRAEDAHITTQTTVLNNVENHNQDYFRIYPSVFLTQKLTENQTLQLSYSRRVSRPRDRQISPFLDRSDRQNYQQGNPNLRPEDTHAFELSYINYFKALTLTSSLYYRKTLDDIQRIQTLYGNSSTITLTTFDNVTSASNGGYELIAKLTPSKIIDLTGNVNVYYRSINGNALQGIRSSSGTSFNGNLTANVKPLPKLGFQIRGDYQGRQVTAQGTQNALYGVDGGLKYDITKTLNFSANARDIFNTRKFSNTVTSGDGRLFQTSDRRFATRIVLFTLSYRFGQTVGGNKQQRKKQDQQRDDQQDQNPDDMNPNNGGNNGGGGSNPTAPPLNTSGKI
ncbi:TonB-dependent receptor domain-containing protein [Mucilaginibacter ginkgonis]|uniref:TonB-dependent receptor n=1 Tax=Mucilaginibacter ginkgonis TaxID=2682091 RepID=A0A7T7FAI2_9SPHI|nr:TonB-dependent receptor [Mucilaginibacter ginkgonis]QQL49800.1 TonB-dependent receptor [Mucilaginibacter ginkgonis]